MLALLLAVVVPAAPATPLPIIVTTKTSVLCNAVRTIVAPSIQGLFIQDGMIDRGRELLQDMAKMDVAQSDGWVEADNVHLLDVVDDVAANNIKIHALLEKLATVALKDPQEAHEVASLGARLSVVADLQADSLNEFSGTADTQELADIENFKNPMAAMVRPDAQQDRTVQTTQASETRLRAPKDFSYGNLISADAYGNIAVDVALTQYRIGVEESEVRALVQPLVNRCR